MIKLGDKPYGAMQSCPLAQPDPVIRDRPLEGSSLIGTDVWVRDTLDPPVMEKPLLNIYRQSGGVRPKALDYNWFDAASMSRPAAANPFQVHVNVC
jgi:hypothetical protein